jgi:hypothetical protein
MSEDVRVVKSKDENGVFFGIRKVWFSSKGSLQSVDPADYTPYGETAAELRTDLSNLTKAMNKPIVDATDR